MTHHSTTMRVTNGGERTWGKKSLPAKLQPQQSWRLKCNSICVSSRRRERCFVFRLIIVLYFRIPAATSPHATAAARHGRAQFTISSYFNNILLWNRPWDLNTSPSCRSPYAMGCSAFDLSVYLEIRTSLRRYSCYSTRTRRRMAYPSSGQSSTILKRINTVVGPILQYNLVWALDGNINDTIRGMPTHIIYYYHITIFSHPTLLLMIINSIKRSAWRSGSDYIIYSPAKSIIIHRARSENYNIIIFAWIRQVI